MKNSLTIYAPIGNGIESKYRNVENFQTLENGVSIFNVGADTKLMFGAAYDLEDSSLPVGMEVRFNGNFTYYDYTKTATGDYEEPKSDGHW